MSAFVLAGVKAKARTQARPYGLTGLIESHPHDVIVTKEAPNYGVAAS